VSPVLVEIANLSIAFPTRQGLSLAVREVSLTLGVEKLGIVGESGSGKSLTARSILRLLPPEALVTADRLNFDGIDVMRAGEAALRAIRGRRAGLILQDPKFSLNPVMTAGDQIAEAWRAHRKGTRREARQAALDLLAQVQIRDPVRVAASYPHELSGGMGQRVMIAMMLAPDPELLIADEPTSALDAITQSEILELFRRLNRQLNMAMLFISHDLLSVASLCSRIAILQRGQIIESGATEQMFREPRTEDTRALLQAVLRNPFATQPSELISRG
jgi:peptide/nickel transport system ATP-binding protein